MTGENEGFFYSNKAYYDRNAENYERASWYYFNRYKNAEVLREIRKCIDLLGKNRISVLEIGPGTGYLLHKLLQQKVEVEYSCIEHSEEMARILAARHERRCSSFRVYRESVSAAGVESLNLGSYDLIIGSSILHHLIDYDAVVRGLSRHLKQKGILYFVREPIHRLECTPPSLLSNLLERSFHAVNAVLCRPRIAGRIKPEKIKAEDASQVALHMFKDGVSAGIFRELRQQGFEMVFFRKYNRRISSRLSYLENKWLARFRKDIFGNTLYSVCLQKTAGDGSL